MTIERAISIRDLRDAARRALPKIIFDFIEGGVEDEHCLRRNTSWNEILFAPHYLAEMPPTTLETTLFGRTFDAPFGIAPTGLNALFRPNADLLLAQAACAANIPFILSTAANASLEEAVAVGGENVWFQLYGARDRAISADMIRRADTAGVRVLVVTIDTPASSKRERNQRNGFSRPLRMRPSILLEALTHPAWIVRYLRNGGTPNFGNWIRYAGDDANRNAVTAFSTRQTPNRQTWDDLAEIRRLWPHTLIVKGVLRPEDARQAIACGANGIIVSNHGGRVLDRAPTPLMAFPRIQEAVGKDVTLMIDSGITRGSDVVSAHAVGASFAFVGRATLYGVAAGGRRGADRAITILRDEIRTALEQIGAPSVAALDQSFLWSTTERT